MNTRTSPSFVASIWQSEKQDGDMGSSAMTHNDARLAFFASRAISPHHCWLNHQQHGRKITIIDEHSQQPTLQEGDGLITTLPGEALAITVADCPPLYLADSSSGAIAILHSGRRSTGILVEAIEILQARFAINPSDLHLYIGCGIAACCHQVDRATLDDFLNQFYAYWIDRAHPNGIWGRLQRHSTRHIGNQENEWWINLQAANIALARQRGVVHVAHDPRCSCCNPHLFSYRREGKEHYGHMIAVIERRSVC